MLNSFSITIVTIATILNVSCQSKSNKNIISHPAKDSNVTITKTKPQVNDSGLSSTKGISLKASRTIEVLSINKEINDITADDYSKCRSWSLTGKQIKSILRKFEPMSSEEQYLSYSFYTCRISGEIKIDDTKYKYWLGAGGTLTIENGDTTLYYGCPDKKCNEYFISGEETKEGN